MSASRRHGRSRKQYEDERFYPVRVRVELPEDRGPPYMDRLYEWLPKRAPRAHAIHPAPMLGHDRILDGIDIYPLDPGLVQPMLSELGLNIAVGPEPELR